MERLTQKFGGKNVVLSDVDNKVSMEIFQKKGECPISFYKGEAIDKLAAYEDLDLTPEEIKSSLEDYRDVSNQYLNLAIEHRNLKAELSEYKELGLTPAEFKQIACKAIIQCAEAAEKARETE